MKEGDGDRSWAPQWLIRAERVYQIAQVFPATFTHDVVMDVMPAEELDNVISVASAYRAVYGNRG